MKTQSKELSENQVLQKYDKLYDALLDLVSALNVMEPGGTLLDDIVFTAREGKQVQVAYVATPIQLTINTPERKLILKVIENPSGDKSIAINPSRIEKQAREVSL